MTEEQLATKQQAGLDGWYILEIFGHQRYAGYVTVQNIGISAMVRVDVPPLKERRRELKRPSYVADQYLPAGTVVEDGPTEGYTKLFGVGAIYAMTPCTEAACLAAVEELQQRPVKPISIPTVAKQIEPPDDEGDPDDQEPV